MKNLFLLVFCILLISSCKKSFDLYSDKDLTSTFTKAEIEDIRKMINFVDHKVLKLTGESDINTAYRVCWEKVLSAQHAAQIEMTIKDEEKLAFLNSLNQSTFEAFFELDTCFQRVRYKDTVLYNLCGIERIRMSYNGRYKKYLLELGKEDERFKDLYETLEAAGDVSPSLYPGFAHVYPEIDIQSPKWRIYSAFLILRLGEPIEVKIDRYFEKKGIANL